MATLNFSPKLSNPSKFQIFEETGAFPTDEDHSGVIELGYRVVNRIWIHVLATGSVPTGAGTLRLKGQLDDDAYIFNVSRYYALQDSTGVTEDGVTTTWLWGVATPAVDTASGALLSAVWVPASFADNMAMGSAGVRWDKLTVDYDSGTASAAGTFTRLALALDFGEL